MQPVPTAARRELADSPAPQSLGLLWWRRRRRRLFLPLSLRKRTLVQKSLVAIPERPPIILECGRRHRRIAEIRMALHLRRPLLPHVAARRFISIVISALRHIVHLGRRRRSCCINHRRMMRTTSQRKRNQKCARNNPSRHRLPRGAGVAPHPLVRWRILLPTPLAAKCCAPRSFVCLKLTTSHPAPIVCSGN